MDALLPYGRLRQLWQSQAIHKQTQYIDTINLSTIGIENDTALIIGLYIEILKRAHGKTAPETNYQDTKPTTNPTRNTLLDIARIPARNQRQQHKTPKYLHRLLSQ